MKNNSINEDVNQPDSAYDISILLIIFDDIVVNNVIYI